MVIDDCSKDATATEAGPTTGQFTVSRGTNASGNLAVSYTMAGTASNTADYATLSGSVTISNGQTDAAITVAPVDDSLAEGDETVIVSLASNVNYFIVAPTEWNFHPQGPLAVDFDFERIVPWL